MWRKKKVLFLFLVLFLPFLVFASDIDDLELKWSFTEDIVNYSSVYITDYKIIFRYNKSFFSYNKDGSCVVSVRKERENNFDFYEYQNELFFMDGKFNITFNTVVNNWSVIDKNLYPDYAVDYPCIYKRLTSYIEEYNNDYILYVANTPVSSIIRIYDKNGNIVKDFSKDAKNIHMGPTYVTIKDNAILIGMKENFDLYCPTGINDTMGEVDSRDNVLAKQILYYDFPYDIFTKTDGNGNITVSEKTSYRGYFC